MGDNEIFDPFDSANTGEFKALLEQDDKPKGFVDHDKVPETVQQLQKRLRRDKHNPIEAEIIGDEIFLTLDDLILHMHENPLHTFERTKRMSAWLARFGMFPVSSYMGTGLLGLRYQEPDNTIVKPKKIQAYLDEVSQINKLDMKNLTYLLLTDKEIDTIQPLIFDATAREDYMHQHMDEVYSRNSADETLAALLRKSISLNASDIHFERAEGQKTRIRIRVDGDLQESKTAITDAKLNAVISRAKIQADMKIDEKRRPQDGSIIFTKEQIQNNPQYENYSLRLSTIPTPKGEKMVVRLVKSGGMYDLNKLGYDDRSLRKIERLANEPSGLIAVVGPTGSGKTTTLYAILNKLNTVEVNIMTAEDPIETELPGIIQSQVNKAIDWTFPNILKHYLRQDPDKILVGETRDEETAQLIVTAAQTGHTVFTTLHTNDAVGTVPRLLKYIDGDDLQSILRGVISQRLIKTVDPDCIVAYNGANDLNDLLEDTVFSNPVELYKIEDQYTNRNKHDGLGYKGRVALTEIWTIDRAAQDLMASNSKKVSEYTQAAIASGMVPMAVNGVGLALAGKTTLDAVRSVVRPIEFIENRQLIKELVENYQAA